VVEKGEEEKSKPEKSFRKKPANKGFGSTDQRGNLGK